MKSKKAKTLTKNQRLLEPHLLGATPLCREVIYIIADYVTPVLFERNIVEKLYGVNPHTPEHADWVPFDDSWQLYHVNAVLGVPYRMIDHLGGFLVNGVPFSSDGQVLRFHNDDILDIYLDRRIDFSYTQMYLVQGDFLYKNLCCRGVIKRIDIV